MRRTGSYTAGALAIGAVLAGCTAPGGGPPDQTTPSGDTVWAAEPDDGELARLAAREKHPAEQFYFVLTDRFADADPGNNTGGIDGGPLDHGHDPTGEAFYHGGDLQGVEENLDYIEGLGTTALWLTPVVVNAPVQSSEEWTGAGYHGYWGLDFLDVDPHLGTKEDLSSLIGAAHERDMKVYLDIVVNHTADVIQYAEDGNGYVSKEDSPYTDTDGNAFDDAAYASGDGFPEVDGSSFPHTPEIPEGREDAKNPDWLNDTANYHNRGDSTWAGESVTYGDFAGLDGLWTERPEVVDGWVDVYSQWIADMRVDGFRIDTVKHVNMEFWPRFVDGVKTRAEREGVDFFAFGEVYSGDPSETSPYVRQGKLDATLDFGFQGAASSFASGGAPGAMADLAAQDYLYTARGTDAYSLPTFLSNHDMGRIGRGITEKHPEGEWLDRMVLAHQAMFLTRGQPVVYYGDEQGFVGHGGDDASRQSLFASEVPEWQDLPVIGTDKGHGEDHYDTGHPLYQAIAELGALRKDHPALADGVKTVRAVSDNAFAITARDPETGEEYLAVLSNAVDPSSVTVPTGASSLEPVYGEGTAAVADGEATVEVDGLSAAVFRSGEGAPTGEAPEIGLDVPDESATTASFRANVQGDPLAQVVFAATVDGSNWFHLGTSRGPDHAVALDLEGLAGATEIEVKAVAVDRDGRTASAKGTTTVATPDESGSAPGWATIHFDGDADEYGVYAWGDVDERSSTTWPESNPFWGESEWGSFASIKLAPDAANVGFLVIDSEGNKLVESDREFDPSVNDEIWLEAGSEEVHTSLAEARGHVRVRYPEPDWDLHVWGSAAAEETPWEEPLQPSGTDSWGAYWDVPVQDVNGELGLIVHKGDDRAHPEDILVEPARVGDLWVTPEGAHDSRAAADNEAVLHYRRDGGDYEDWKAHVWAGAETPTDWDGGIEPDRTDRFGAVYSVPLEEGAEALSYVLHRGDEKDLPDDQLLDTAEFGNEVWIVESTPGYVRPGSGAVEPGENPDLSKSRAHWLSEDTVALPRTETDGKAHRLLSSADGGLAIEDGAVVGDFSSVPLTPVGGLPEHLRKANPHLWDYSAFRVDTENAGELLRTQLAVVEERHDGTLLNATGVQIPGVLDDLYAAPAADEPLGLTWKGKKPRLSVWAPTATSVHLELFDAPDGEPSDHEMEYDSGTGVWSVKGAKDWDRKYYRYRVSAWQPATGAFETASVTDPYSVSLAADSTHSQIVDLDDADLKPEGWDGYEKPAAAALEEAQIWEVQVRDFSVADPTVPEELRGTYMAFAEEDSASVRHLEELADAGMTHVHLQPTFDFATVPETGAAQPDCDLPSHGGASEEQQQCVGEVRADDAYNWGYDPHHFNTPEGSYATDPHGARRIREYREMVKALNDLGLRVVVDVVYNHTSASGAGEKSVFDRIVPGYYHRLDADGNVETSTCCQNTAPEHAMMDRFIADSAELWAREYKVDGLRFDLMGHHPKANLLRVQEAVAAVDPDVVLYGEGWNFGEVADGARFEQASQTTMAGTGIATFNDRLRDGARGGGPFDDDPTHQGWGTGQGDGAGHNADLVKIGLVGNLAAYEMLDHEGRSVRGDEIDYNGSPAGYAEQPGDVVNYVDAHDNEILFDALAYKLDASASGTDRARAQVLNLSTTVFNQGAGLVTAGSELMRSKSLDRDSYDSGDWFNAIRWQCSAGANAEGFGDSANGFPAGMPPRWTSEHHWDYAADTLAAVEAPDCDDVLLAKEKYLELLRIASSTKAFSLGDADEVRERVSFHEAEGRPGVIAMEVDLSGLGEEHESMVVVFNNGGEDLHAAVDGLDSDYELHPVLRESFDEPMRDAELSGGTVSVPAWGTAVFTS
ncbi:pullulanase-type alpha-1,6-glucosidase [Salininema proteolyticum]|uniref:1,4-alpha-D-glucan glucanohydrolase n=1 Tax=Salininema proteolyticum TaxID=1607685 RepID=A0ABV8TZJ9_9ACTN